MEFSFHNLEFKIIENKIYLIKAFSFKKPVDEYQEKYFNFVEVQVAGENKDSHYGSKRIRSSEGTGLEYVSHTISGDILTIKQRSEKIEVTTTFTAFKDSNAIQVKNSIKNISDDIVCLEDVSIIKIMGLGGGINETKDTYIYKFTQSHHAECQPRRFSLYDLGLFNANPISQKRISGMNIGSWSTKEELPQAIIEYKNSFLMFQIESNNSWYYEVSDDMGELYLYLSGPSTEFGGWHKNLNPNETYETNNASICYGNSLNELLGEMTKYRRHIKGNSIPDKHLPTIFNEYMHLSWDSPNEERTINLAKTVKELGVEYYVIDCGWHNEEPGSIIYPYVGQWKESKARFPSGIRKTTDYIRSLGMKAGLWIEPEVIGYKCQEMLEYYDDDCFIKRYGKKVLTMGRYFLDFRNKKVYSYLSETISRMVMEYGADYIKMDYNEDLGIGTDKDSDSLGEGLERCVEAYLSWVDDMRTRFPNVLFETCSSGGMRMDYETLKHFSIISTSDQTDYKKYPYIAGNILTAVLPEQAAVWSYPVDSYGTYDCAFKETKEWVEGHISKEQVIMNMINSFLGRMHLASHIELLSKEKLSLIKEGIEYFNTLSDIKKIALPYLPVGFTDFSKNTVISGFKHENRIFLAIWNLDGDNKKEVEFESEILKATVTYPKNSCEIKTDKNKLEVILPDKYSARFFEIEITK